MKNKKNIIDFIGWMLFTVISELLLLYISKNLSDIKKIWLCLYGYMFFIFYINAYLHGKDDINEELQLSIFVIIKMLFSIFMFHHTSYQDVVIIVCFIIGLELCVPLFCVGIRNEKR